MAMAGKNNVEEIRRFINDLGDEYIIQWANRGLFRRGGKLAEKALDADLDIHNDRITAHLGGCTQTISGPGLAHAACDCPAVSACHHLTAFLIAIRRRATERGDATGGDGEKKGEPPARPWLISDPAALDKALGKAALKRARKMMLHAVPARLAEDDGGLVAVIDEKKEFTVRIPRNGGLKASLCSCKSERCAHRALAVLAALIEAGMLRLEDIEEEPLAPGQKRAIQQMETWVRELLIHGLGSATRSHQEPGESLAILARQADLPNLASQMTGLCKWIADHRERASRLRVDSARYQLARLSATLNALNTTPPPRPMRQIAGAHTRFYRVIRNVDLIGVGVERWDAPSGYSGFTLYLYAPDREEWFTHARARPTSHVERRQWKPEKEYLRARWADGPALRSIPGARIRLVKGWVSEDNRLSGREGVRVEEGPPSRDGIEGAVFTDFSALAETYRALHSRALFSDDAPTPAIIQPIGFDKPEVDAYGGAWTQNARDRQGRKTTLRIEADPRSRRRVDNLEKRTWPPGKEAVAIFGALSLNRSALTMHPISVAGPRPFVWSHLTM